VRPNIWLPLELVDHRRRPLERIRERPVELGHVRDGPRRADLGDQLLAQLLGLTDDRLVQLLEATSA
jgi:hypothetical protein